MKLPNKYGTVTKLSGNRRKPFIVKEGKTGQQKIIGYASTREEGLLILAKYNENPWDLEKDNVTVKELYELWLEKRWIKLGQSNQRQLKSVYNKHCTSLYNLPYKQLRAYHIQECIDKSGCGSSVQKSIRNLFWHLDKFAFELDIINKTYSNLATTDKVETEEKVIFTDEEVNKIWNSRHLEMADTVLFMLYTGFRINEVLSIKLEDIDLEQNTIQGGSKTEAGKGRLVPIHSKIKNIVLDNMEHNKKYLFEKNGKQIKYATYYRYWLNLMSQLEMSHTPHECRHTLRSRLDSLDANKVCIDRILGHKSGDTGERVYTHKKVQELQSAIELITN